MFRGRRRDAHSVDAHITRLLDGMSSQAAVGGACDRCSAVAAVRFRLPSGSILMLCGHHGRRHGPALQTQGAVITGEVAMTARSGQPAAKGAG